MAQNITLMGASYSDVPSVLLPKTGGGQALFTDVTDTTAAAADVASGKYFYTAAGAYTQGTATSTTPTLITKSITQNGTYSASSDNADGYSSVTVNVSGGGGNVKVGALRPDAELVQSWTYDKLIVDDEGVTIPAYTTSATSLKAGGNITTNVQLDLSQYDYIVMERGLATPVYSTGTLGAARQAYSMFNCAFEVYCVPRTAVSVEGKSPAGYLISTNAYPAYYTNVYWTSATTVNQNTTNYGAYQTYPTPTLSVTSTTNGTATYTIKSPSFYLRGSTSNMNETYWNYLTDIRFQYIIELWKVPRTSSVYGFTVTSQIRHTIECAQSANGTLS